MFTWFDFLAVLPVLSVSAGPAADVALATMSKEDKNVFKATCNKPLRFAVLGPHRSSKSAFVSIIANQISLANYYPTIQNSPILLQFQPKRETTRSILDINISLDELDQIGLLHDEKFIISEDLLKKINIRSIKTKKKIHNLQSSQERKQFIEDLHSTDKILKLTNNYYDLDYTKTDMFDDESFSPINSFHSPIASFSVGQSFGNSFANSAGMKFPKMSSIKKDQDTEFDDKYKPPVTTPILIELIDTPGVQRDDLIPFLERSLDSRLSRDVLSNLANEYNTNYRSRVKPLITGSGISDLNAGVNGYLLFYSCIPETDDIDSLPPAYENVINDTNLKLSAKNEQPIEVLKCLYISIRDAWREYNSYQNDWEESKEYDNLSLTSSIKQLWKDKDKLKDSKSSSTAMNNSSSNNSSFSNRNNKIKNKEKTDGLDSKQTPPVVVVCTHIDSPQAAPLLIQHGRELAKEWGCTFVQMSCAYNEDEWANVEEALAVAIREVVEG